MHDARLFLYNLTKELPPANGMRHNLTVDDDDLILTLMLDSGFYPIELDWKDISKPLLELVDEVKREMGME